MLGGVSQQEEDVSSSPTNQPQMKMSEYKRYKKVESNC